MEPKYKSLEETIFPFLSKQGFRVFQQFVDDAVFEDVDDLRVEKVNTLLVNNRDVYQVCIGPKIYFTEYSWEPKLFTNLKFTTGRFGTNYFIDRRNNKLLLEKENVYQIILEMYRPEIRDKKAGYSNE